MSSSFQKDVAHHWGLFCWPMRKRQEGPLGTRMVSGFRMPRELILSEQKVEREAGGFAGAAGSSDWDLLLLSLFPQELDPLEVSSLESLWGTPSRHPSCQVRQKEDSRDTTHWASLLGSQLERGLVWPPVSWGGRG